MIKEEMLLERIRSICPADAEAMAAARAYQDTLAKPPRSLGRLEDLAVQMAGISGDIHFKPEKKRLLVFAADNGVVAEGVSSAPQSVTLMQTVNLTRGMTGAATIAKHFGAELQVIDVGVNAEIHCPAVVDRKIAFGTKNMVKEPAMSREEAVLALSHGFDAAETAAKEGISVLGIGEMGIGNTTTSAAVLSALTDLSVEQVTGKGGGITDQSFERKKQVIRDALALHAPDAKDPIDVLAKVGGFDLAAMTGAFLGAAACRIPVVIDGFISVVAALAAARLAPNAKDYMIPSHASFEIGYEEAMKELGLTPMLLLNMRLGEGSGCPLAFQILDAAAAVMNEMATFAEAEINDDYLTEIRQGDKFTV